MGRVKLIFGIALRLAYMYFYLTLYLIWGIDMRTEEK